MIPAWYQTAINEMGQQEITGRKSNPRVLEYQTKSGYNAANDDVPWCGSFVGWVMATTGVMYNFNTAAQAKSWEVWGKALPVDSKLPIGAVLVWDHHVAFFAGWENEELRLARVLGGNQSNRVQISTFDLKKPTFRGARWPAGIPTPVGAQPLKTSTIMKAAVPLAVPAIAVVADSSTEIVSSLNAAHSQWSAGGIFGLVCGLILLFGIGVVIWGRIKVKTDEEKIAVISPAT